MNEITLTKRDLLGKKSKRLAADNMVPTVIYNSKGESRATAADKGDIERILQDATSSTVIDVELDGKKVKALVKETDIDPIKHQIRHVAFFEIDENESMTFEIPVKLIGVSQAVKNNIGVLVQPLKYVEVRCKLKDLVDSIEVDISEMDNIGDSILLSNIELPDGMEYPRKEDANRAIASITQLQKLVETVEEEEADEDEEGVEGEEGEEGAEGEEAAEGETSTEGAEGEASGEEPPAQ